jgi:carboxyl-terminal processing protease
MGDKMRQVGLVVFGVIAGVMLSLNFSAVANKEETQEIMHPLPVEELRAFTEVFGRIKTDYVEPVQDKKLITEAINGMLTGLDPHSAYLDADAFKELQIGTQGEFGGLGIEVSMEDGFVKVISPIEDTPAFRAGIKTGDLIIKLDDTAVKGLSLTDAIKRMRGKPNTPITLTVLRKGETKPLVFTLVRAVIKIQSVKSKLLEPGYAYIRITQFQEQTGENLTKAIDKLFKESTVPMKGLVLDLRNDPGGLLNGAVAVSAAFLPANSLVVYTDGRTDDAKMKLKASPEFYLRDTKNDYLKRLPPDIKTVPMVTLVNGGSASASEIVAGALQDHKRSVVMGTQTFGKGSVQTILPLGNNTAIKLTTARYYTPNGQSIQAKGITPDILDEAAKDDTERLREADLTRHLRNGKQEEVKEVKEIKPEPEAKDAVTPLMVPKAPKPTNGDDKNTKREPPAEFGSPEDLLLTQAMNYFKEGGAKKSAAKVSN